MNLAWSSLAILLVLLPGIMALWRFSSSSQGTAPDLQTANAVVAVTVSAGAIHAVAVAIVLFYETPLALDWLTAVIGVRGQGDSAGAGEQLGFQAAAVGILNHWNQLVLYGLATCSAGGIVGEVCGQLYARNHPPANQDIWLISKGSVWTFLDIMAEEKRLYRGIYHSHMPESEKQAGYVALVLASRWSGEFDTARAGRYVPIRNLISSDEVADMVLQSLVEAKGEAEARSAYKELLEGDSLREYIIKSIEGPPQMVIPWSRIENINVRQFAVRRIEGVAEPGVRDVMDRGAGWVLLGLLAPLIMVLAFLIRAESSGAAFHFDRRVGQSGRVFLMTRLRTKRENGSTTRLGRVLRRWGLDRLPMLFNVIRGEMSLVGPRAARPKDVEGYQDWHKGRLAIKPGITGLWQVSGGEESNFDEMVVLDLFYIENRSLGMDVRILGRAMVRVLTGRAS